MRAIAVSVLKYVDYLVLIEFVSVRLSLEGAADPVSDNVCSDLSWFAH